MKQTIQQQRVARAEKNRRSKTLFHAATGKPKRKSLRQIIKSTKS